MTFQHSGHFGIASLPDFQVLYSKNKITAKQYLHLGLLELS